MSGGVINGDGPMPDEFMPGCLWHGNLPPGTQGASGSGPDSVPADYTGGSGDPWDRHHAASHGTNQAGQNGGDEQFGCDADQATTTGAGDGDDGSHYPRFPWQQAAT